MNKLTTLDYIESYCHGRNNAIPGHQIAMAVYGDNSTASLRKVQKDIAELRQEGHCICGIDKRPNGYYIPSTVDEAQEFFTNCKNRARSTFIMVANVTKSLNRKFGDGKFQMEINFDVA